MPPVQSAVAIGDLLAVARARLERQPHYAAMVTRGQRQASGLRAALDRAQDCLSALARPKAVRIPLDARVDGGRVLLAGLVAIEERDLAAEVAAGGQLTACVATLGHSQDAAFAWLGGDYALHHFQTDLARECLFALARQADRVERARIAPGRLRRIPVRSRAAEGARRAWDPDQVQALLALFGPCNPGVTLTPTGFFQPLHALLGLAVALPGRTVRAACPVP